MIEFMKEWALSTGVLLGVLLGAGLIVAIGSIPIALAVHYHSAVFVLSYLPMLTFGRTWSNMYD